MPTAKQKMQIIAKVEYKCDLIDRIDRGREEIKRVNALAKIEKDIQVQMKMYQEVRRGESIISPLVTERLKLSADKIAREIGVEPHFVRYRQKLCCGTTI